MIVELLLSWSFHETAAEFDLTINFGPLDQLGKRYLASKGRAWYAIEDGVIRGIFSNNKQKNALKNLNWKIKRTWIFHFSPKQTNQFSITFYFQTLRIEWQIVENIMLLKWNFYTPYITYLRNSREEKQIGVFIFFNQVNQASLLFEWMYLHTLPIQTCNGSQV